MKPPSAMSKPGSFYSLRPSKYVQLLDRFCPGGSKRPAHLGQKFQTRGTGDLTTTISWCEGHQSFSNWVILWKVITRGVTKLPRMVRKIRRASIKSAGTALRSPHLWANSKTQSPVQNVRSNISLPPLVWRNRNYKQSTSVLLSSDKNRVSSEKSYSYTFNSWEPVRKILPLINFFFRIKLLLFRRKFLFWLRFILICFSWHYVFPWPSLSYASFCLAQIWLPCMIDHERLFDI